MLNFADFVIDPLVFFFNYFNGGKSKKPYSRLVPKQGDINWGEIEKKNVNFSGYRLGE